jgi:hypothetical protein
MTSDPTGWHHADCVAYVDDGERVAVLALKALDQLGARLLTGPAAAIWRAARVGGDEKAIAAAAARETGVDVAAVVSDVHGFLADLERHGFVVRD